MKPQRHTVMPRRRSDETVYGLDVGPERPPIETRNAQRASESAHRAAREGLRPQLTATAWAPDGRETSLPVEMGHSQTITLQALVAAGRAIRAGEVGEPAGAYRLSNRQAKEAHRDVGLELVVVWPESLPEPQGLAEDEERPATAAEGWAIVRLLAQALEAAELPPTAIIGVFATRLRRPTDWPLANQIASALVVRLRHPKHRQRAPGRPPVRWLSTKA